MIKEFVKQNLPSLYMTNADGDFVRAEGIVIPEIQDLANKIRHDTLKEVREKMPKVMEIDKKFIAQSDFETGFNQAIDEVQDIFNNYQEER